MASPLICDAVTLCHFASVHSLDVLERRHGHLEPPHWTEAIQGEIEAGLNLGAEECRPVLEAAWLGEPIAPDDSDRLEILRLLVGLNDGSGEPKQHAGEAEGIYFAEKLGGRFATDDNAAFDLAQHRLGAGRVLDSVAILQDAVAMDDVTADQALGVATSIRASGRHLRRVHPETLTPGYFTL